MNIHLRSVLAAAFAAAVAGAIVAHVTPVAAQAPDYTVNVQDVLTFTVWDQPDMTGKYTVEADGTIAMPMVGRVKVVGLKVRDVENEVKRRLADGYIKNPQLSVLVESNRAQRVFIVGEVRSPGALPYTEGMTFIEALAQVGSTTSDASQEALVVRPRTTGATGLSASADGAKAAAAEGPEIFKVDIKKLVAGGFDQNITLRGGDTIFVSRVEMFYIIGQVKSPGPQPARRDLTVMQALALAGGVTDRGSQDRIHILRMVNGTQVEIQAKPSYVIQPGDTVVVLSRLL